MNTRALWALPLALATSMQPAPAAAQLNCSEHFGAGREQCQLINQFSTRQQAMELIQTVTAQLGQQIEAKQYAKACLSARTLVEVSRDYVPEMHLRSLRVQQSVCALTSPAPAGKGVR